MHSTIAKRYAKAISLDQNHEDLEQGLRTLASAFKDAKFLKIIASYDLSKDKKIEFLLSLLTATKPLQNLITILAYNSRLGLIPLIVEELNKARALKEGSYLGVIYSKETLTQDEISRFEKNLSQKFQANIKLENKINKTNGIKIALDELGYELSFSMQSLRAKMSDYILKTI